MQKPSRPTWHRNLIIESFPRKRLPVNWGAGPTYNLVSIEPQSARNGDPLFFITRKHFRLLVALLIAPRLLFTLDFIQCLSFIIFLGVNINGASKNLRL